jgi:hypothetical protein
LPWKFAGDPVSNGANSRRFASAGWSNQGHMACVVSHFNGGLHCLLLLVVELD